MKKSVTKQALLDQIEKLKQQIVRLEQEEIKTVGDCIATFKYGYYYEVLGDASKGNKSHYITNIIYPTVRHYLQAKAIALEHVVAYALCGDFKGEGWGIGRVRGKATVSRYTSNEPLMPIYSSEDLAFKAMEICADSNPDWLSHKYRL